MDKEKLISDTLLLPFTAIEYHMSQQLAELFPEKALLEGDIGCFNVEGYAAAGHCTLSRKAFLYNQVSTHWKGPDMMPWQFAGMQGMIDGRVPGQSSEASEGTLDNFKKAWLEVQWEGATLDVIVWTCDDTQFYKSRYWIIADSAEVARRFLSAVCAWNTELRSEVLVFDGGNWYKDERLFHDIKNATFDNLILQGNLKQDIRADITQFFAARETYDECGVPWKRGILFVGPPGNGKTHAVKALINTIEQPCLYVKSFRSPHGAPDEICIRMVFDRARKTAPCVLVLEDLDSLVTPQNRSFFLNELDGFASNIGIVALATTNHPERLDPAILDRPSRFDRKYPFSLPELAERRAYIAMWNGTLKPLLRLTEEGMEKISEQTQDFSFAYLKELFLSSMMHWISSPQQNKMDDIMAGQVDTLREQMVSATTLTEPVVDEAQGQLPSPFMVRTMMRHMRS